MGYISCKSKMQDNNTKAEKRETEIYYYKMLILYIQYNVT